MHHPTDRIAHTTAFVTTELHLATSHLFSSAPFRPRQNKSWGLGWDKNRFSCQDIRTEGALLPSITVISEIKQMSTHHNPVLYSLWVEDEIKQMSTHHNPVLYSLWVEDEIKQMPTHHNPVLYSLWVEGEIKQMLTHHNPVLYWSVG